MSGEPTVRVEGDVSGQVAVGDFVYQAQVIGGIINQIKIAGPPIVARPVPVDGRGPAPLGFHGREQETTLLMGRLREGPVQVFGADGIGKTFLLRHLLHSQAAAEARDGAVLVSGFGEDVEDILQSVFEMFYDSALPQLELKATPTQIRTAMRDRIALIGVDDAPPDRHQLERLLLHLPGSKVVVTATDETLMGNGSTLVLKGLDPESARQVFLEHSGLPSGADQALLEAAVATTNGHPASLVRLGRAIERGDLSLEDLAAPAEPSVASLGIPERRVLAVLDAVAGAPLPLEAIGFVAELPEPRSILEGLRGRGLVAAASPRYRLVGSVAGAGGEDWIGVTLKRLAGWVPSSTPEALAAAAGAFRRVVQRGLRAEHYSGVVALARAAVPDLVVGRRWGAARSILAAARDSADQLGDPAAQGWVHHELGTLMACGGDHQHGIEMLRLAESLRMAAGDEAGVAVTRHNLRQLLPLPGPPPQAPPPEPPPVEPPPMAPPPAPAPPTKGRRWWPWVGLVLVMVVIVVYLVNRPDPPIDPPETTTVTTERREPPLTVVGMGPDLRFDTSPIEFAEPESESPSAVAREVVNAGDEPPEFFRVGVSRGEAFAASQQCDVPQPGEVCLVIVEFSPDGPGDYFDTLFLEWDSDRREIELHGAVEFPPVAAPDLAAVIVETGRGEARGPTAIRAATVVIEEVSVPVVVEVLNFGGPFDVESRLHFEGFREDEDTWQPVPIGSAPFEVERIFVAPPAPGSSEMIEAWVTLTLAQYPGQSAIDVRAIVDSCFAEEFQPDFCRVEESVEDNNTSEVATIDLETALG